MNHKSTNDETVTVHPIAHSRLMLDGIGSAGYDAQYQILELEFSDDGQIWQFYDVPEHIWYEWRRVREMRYYYHTKIFGQYKARLVYERSK